MFVIQTGKVGAQTVGEDPSRTSFQAHVSPVLSSPKVYHVKQVYHSCLYLLVLLCLQSRCILTIAIFVCLSGHQCIMHTPCARFIGADRQGNSLPLLPRHSPPLDHWRSFGRGGRPPPHLPLAVACQPQNASASSDSPLVMVEDVKKKEGAKVEQRYGMNLGD